MILASEPVVKLVLCLMWDAVTRHVTNGLMNKHFFLFRSRPVSSSLERTLSRLIKCSASLAPVIKISSKYIDNTWNVLK